MQNQNDLGITKNETLQLRKEHLKTKALRKHSLAAELIMMKIAQKKGGNEDLWGIAELLNDLAFEDTKNDIPQQT